MRSESKNGGKKQKKDKVEECKTSLNVPWEIHQTPQPHYKQNRRKRKVKGCCHLLFSSFALILSQVSSSQVYTFHHFILLASSISFFLNSSNVFLHASRIKFTTNPSFPFPSFTRLLFVSIVEAYSSSITQNE